MNTNKARLAKKFSLVPLLLAGNSVSAATRQALRENRLKDAGVILMEEHGLSCVEAGHLLDVSVCDDARAASSKPNRRLN
jgi:hypothetical protein